MALRINQSTPWPLRRKRVKFPPAAGNLSDTSNLHDLGVAAPPERKLPLVMVQRWS